MAAFRTPPAAGYRDPFWPIAAAHVRSNQHRPAGIDLLREEARHSAPRDATRGLLSRRQQGDAFALRSRPKRGRRQIDGADSPHPFVAKLGEEAWAPDP